MQLNEYQQKAMSTCMESCDNFAYMFTGMVGEIGEFASKVAKAIRRESAVIDYNRFITEYGTNAMTEAELHDLKSEAGDILWFIAGLCNVMGWPLDEVGQENLDKLASRKVRGVISGNGDNR